jgi:DNA-binding MarR family transcriptional regulator
MITEVSKILKVPVYDILGCIRLKEIVGARHAYWWVLNNNGYSRQQIANLCNVDQSTVTNGIKRFNNLVEIGDNIAVEMYNLVKNIER